MKPIWIKIDDGDTFEGHQGHFANTFFANAYRSMIEAVLANGSLFPGEEFTYEIREMTPEELAKYPEALEFCAELVAEYGEY